MCPVRPLGSPGITPVLCYYGPVRLPVRAERRYAFRRPVASPQGGKAPAGPPRFLDRSFRARHPQSPRSRPDDCTRSSLRRRHRLHHLWKAGRPHWCNEAESGSLSLRLARLHCGASHQQGYPHPRPRCYMSEEQVTWRPPFRSQDRPGLSWRTGEHGEGNREESGLDPELDRHRRSIHPMNGIPCRESGRTLYRFLCVLRVLRGAYSEPVETRQRFF
jgi:hypothetical protein